MLLLVLSAVILTGCGNSEKDTSETKKEQTNTSSKAESNKSTTEGKLKTSDGKTTLIFSTGEEKNGGFPKENTTVKDYQQYMHLNVDSSMNCEMYGYIGELHGSLREWSDMPDVKIKDLDFSEKGVPCFYSLEDKDREIAYHLYDETLEEKYAKEYEEEESLYVYMLPVPALNKLDEEISELENEEAKEIVKKTGETNGFKYTYVTYHYEEADVDTTFYVIYELSDTVRFSYRIMAVEADFDPLAEVESTAKAITLDQ